MLTRELRQQLIPCRRSRSRVDVEAHRDLGMLQLDVLCMDGVAPKQDFLPLRREFIASVAWSVTRQGNELHAVDDCPGACKRAPLAGLDVWRCDGLRTLEERLCILWRLGSDFRRQPKVAFSFRNVNICVWKDTLSVLGRKAADVVGVEVRDQDDVDFFRRVPSAAEVGYQVPEFSPTKPGTGSRIDQDQLPAGVDKVACIGDIEQMRVVWQCL